MESLGVIRKDDEPTDWCHPIVSVKKPKRDLRVSIDLTQLNKNIKQKYYELPSVDETLASL